MRVKSAYPITVVEAISLLKDAEKDWPGGFSNPLIKQRLLEAEHELHEELYEIMCEKKTGRAGAAKKVIQHKEGDRS